MDSRIFYHLKVNATYIRKVINKINITMKAILICFLCFLCLVNAEVIMIDSTCDSVECNFYLMEYVNKVNPKVIYESVPTGTTQPDYDFMPKVSHTKPTRDIAGLYARAFTTRNGEIEIEYFTRTDDASNIYLYIRLYQPEDVSNCEELFTKNSDLYQECSILIKYYNTARNLVKIYTFSVVIRRTGFGSAFLPRYIEPDACDFILDLSLTFKAKVYRGGCEDELSHGSLLSYDEFVCFGVFGDDDISKSFRYEAILLREAYSRPGEDDKNVNMIDIATVRYSIDNWPGKGKFYMYVPTRNIGRWKFSAVIELRDEKWMSTSKAGLVAFPGMFEIDKLYVRFINND